MTDTEMAAELGLSRERIRQIRNKAGAPTRYCACGTRLAPKKEQCSRCAKCNARARWRENPEFRIIHRKRIERWEASLDPERKADLRRKQTAYKKEWLKRRRAAKAAESEAARKPGDAPPLP